MEQLRFTIPETLALLGVFHCVFILVYFLFRAGKISRASLPFLNFFALACAFFFDFSERFLSFYSPYYDFFQLTLWFITTPLSVLMIIQIMQITKLPQLSYFSLLFLPLAAYGGAYVLSELELFCIRGEECNYFKHWYVLSSLFLGACSLLTIWMRRDLINGLLAQKYGKERYWLVMSVIVVNSIFLLSMFGFFSEHDLSNELQLVRLMLGLTLLYLVMTSLFRIYPQAVRYLDPDNLDEQQLTDAELEIAMKIEQLLAFERVHHRENFGRVELARELKIAESYLSKIINSYFKKSLPQLLNERRIEEAKLMLWQSNKHINIVAHDVGFSSLATFNRVFKDIVGMSPSDFRENKKS